MNSTSSDFLDKIQDGLSAGIYLLHGEGEYSKQQSLNIIRKQFSQNGLEELNIQTIDDGSDDIQNIRELCEQLPLMSPMRLVIVKDPPVLRQRNRAESIRTAWGKLGENFSPTTCLIIFLRGKLEVSLTGPLKELARTATVVEFKQDTTREAVQQLMNIAKEQGGKLSASAAQELFLFSGGDMLGAASQLGKLLAYSGKGSEISVSDVHDVITPSTEASIYRMMDCMLTGSFAEGIKIYQTLLINGESPSAVIAIMERQLNAMYHAKNTVAASDMKQAAEILGVRDFVLERILRRRSRLSHSQLRDLILMCADMDYDIKQGLISDRQAVDRIIFTLASFQGGA